MTSNPQSDLPTAGISDKIDLDELFKDAKPIGKWQRLGLPGVFRERRGAAGVRGLVSRGAPERHRLTRENRPRHRRFFRSDQAHARPGDVGQARLT